MHVNLSREPKPTIQHIAQGKARYCVIDFETSNFFERGGAPVEFAAVLVSENTEVLSTFSTLINPGRDVVWDPVAVKIHGITQHMVYESPDCDQVSKEFFQYLMENITHGERVVLTAHNLAFDIKFFQKYLANEKQISQKDYNSIFDYHTHDTMILANMLNDVAKAMGKPLFVKKSNGKVSSSLEALRDTFGLESEGAHGALKDAYDTALCMLRINKYLAKVISETREGNKSYAKTSSMIDAAYVKSPGGVHPSVWNNGCLACGSKNGGLSECGTRYFCPDCGTSRRLKNNEYLT